MTPDLIRSLFTRPDGSYLCARWGRPIVPVVFGLEDQTLAIVKGAIEAVCAMAGHKMSDLDAELGANHITFFLRDWAELPQVPGLDRMIPDLVPLCARLADENANQYRGFRFDPEGSIRAVFSFLRLDDQLADIPAEDLALAQAAQCMLSWGQGAFGRISPLARAQTTVILNPDLAALIRAAYDPVLPDVATDAGHAFRLAARIEAAGNV